MLKRLDYISCIVTSVAVMFFYFLPTIRFYENYSEDRFEAQAYSSISLILFCLVVNYVIIYLFNRNMEKEKLFRRWVKSVAVSATGGVFVFFIYGIFFWISHT